eukprot:TRINITY_DN472_c0_g1_i2.p2 TRINITY_DN472_c0_g1~~TRINITY_DN472_c0_g1_i2.p2  ORF type:complete len:105 (+),score=4.39 TRINITY_DN472_c0_g1_i2:445-759(+)
MNTRNRRSTFLCTLVRTQSVVHFRSSCSALHVHDYMYLAALSRGSTHVCALSLAALKNATHSQCYPSRFDPGCMPVATRAPTLNTCASGDPLNPGVRCPLIVKG